MLNHCPIRMLPALLSTILLFSIIGSESHADEVKLTLAAYERIALTTEILRGLVAGADILVNSNAIRATTTASDETWTYYLYKDYQLRAGGSRELSKVITTILPRIDDSDLRTSLTAIASALADVNEKGSGWRSFWEPRVNKIKALHVEQRSRLNALLLIAEEKQNGFLIGPKLLAILNENPHFSQQLRDEMTSVLAELSAANDRLAERGQALAAEEKAGAALVDRVKADLVEAQARMAGAEEKVKALSLKEQEIQTKIKAANDALQILLSAGVSGQSNVEIEGLELDTLPEFSRELFKSRVKSELKKKIDELRASVKRALRQAALESNITVNLVVNAPETVFAGGAGFIGYGRLEVTIEHLPNKSTLSQIVKIRFRIDDAVDGSSFTTELFRRVSVPRFFKKAVAAEFRAILKNDRNLPSYQEVLTLIQERLNLDCESAIAGGDETAAVIAESRPGRP